MILLLITSPIAFRHVPRTVSFTPGSLNGDEVVRNIYVALNNVQSVSRAIIHSAEVTSCSSDFNFLVNGYPHQSVYNMPKPITRDLFRELGLKRVIILSALLQNDEEINRDIAFVFSHLGEIMTFKDTDGFFPVTFHRNGVRVRNIGIVPTRDRFIPNFYIKAPYFENPITSLTLFRPPCDLPELEIS